MLGEENKDISEFETDFELPALGRAISTSAPSSPKEEKRRDRLPTKEKADIVAKWGGM